MTTALNRMQAAIALAASTAANMTEAQKGGGGARLLPEGYAFGRLVEYIEFGNQPQEFNGKAKEPALEVQLGFALTGTGYQNEDGTPYILRPFPMAISRNEKAKAFLLFKQLNWAGTATHFAQLLGQTFLVKIYTYQPKDATKKPSSSIDLKGFLPPLDPVTKAPYPIAEAPDSMYKVFFWEHPTLEDWDALAIEGTYDDGKSKNHLQNTILGATDWAGSALEALLHSSGKTVPAAPAAAPALPALPGVPLVPPMQPAAPAVPQVPALFQPPVPAVPAVPGLPTLPVIAPTTSPSNPAMPVMPVMPVLPKF